MKSGAHEILPKSHNVNLYFAIQTIKDSDIYSSQPLSSPFTG